MKKIMFDDKYGLTQAVLEGRKTMTRRTEEALAYLKEHYNDTSIVELARHLGVHKDTVSNWARKMGIADGNRKKLIYGNSVRCDRSFVDALRKYYAEHTVKECAEYFGVSRNHIRYVLSVNGIRLRDIVTPPAAPEPRPRSTEREPEMMPRSRRLHQHDESIKAEFPDRLTSDLSEEYGLNYYTVSRKATRLGAKKSRQFMRTRWSSGDHGKRIKYKGETDEYMKAHFHDTSNTELAAVFGVDVKTVRRWARRLGLQKSDAFMFASRSKAKKNIGYTDEYKAWRNERISEVFPDADEDGIGRLCDELGIKRNFLFALARRAGVKRSPERIMEAKALGYKNTRKYSRELLASVAEYYPFHSTEECAEKFGIRLSSLKQIANVHGWKKDKEYIRRLHSEISRRWHREKSEKLNNPIYSQFKTTAL